MNEKKKKEEEVGHIHTVRKTKTNGVKGVRIDAGLQTFLDELTTYIDRYYSYDDDDFHPLSLLCSFATFFFFFSDTTLPPPLLHDPTRVEKKHHPGGKKKSETASAKSTSPIYGFISNVQKKEQKEEEGLSTFFFRTCATPFVS